MGEALNLSLSALMSQYLSIEEHSSCQLIWCGVVGTIFSGYQLVNGMLKSEAIALMVIAEALALPCTE